MASWHGSCSGCGRRDRLVRRATPAPPSRIAGTPSSSWTPWPDAIPCPYPHSSPSCDEVLFYCDGNFTSRRGVGPGSISLHPAGIPHGPHPGAYEGSMGSTRTDELAVMMDTYAPLHPMAAALAIEDPDYMRSFVG